MEATQMFLIRHKTMHARIGKLTEGLTEAQVRTPVHSAANPLAWHLWHVARIEDTAINLLISEEAQVFDDGWRMRLNVVRCDAGVGMTMQEVVDLAVRIDLGALSAYWDAVGERTRTVVERLSARELDQVVSDKTIRDAVVIQHMVEGPTGPRLQAFWKGMTKGFFLVYLPLTHIYEHIGQADLLRGLLGRPGPF
jgi:hypothetical protein